jgi:CDGSH-type Zn-finger protein/uncharacterized Fe-S cluster protein YjdI
MSNSEINPSTSKKKVTIIKNGPIRVQGKVPLVHKTQVVSEFGEPLTWKKDGDIETEAEEYDLCRCGQSSQMPYCDGIHRIIKFDGTETANTHGPSDSQDTLPGGTHLIVKNDTSLCMNSGFCGMRDGDISQFVAASADTKIRSMVMAMVERCPAGALTYKIEEGDKDIEPDLPQQIADTTEITSDGPIQGPFWVTGSIEIERADGQPFDTRNRVTLCNCGLSANKPLCDGSHREVLQQQAREMKTK